MQITIESPMWIDKTSYLQIKEKGDNCVSISKQRRITAPLPKSFFFGFVSIALNVFISLILTPKIIEEVGIEAYGFVTLSSNVISCLNIITVALNAYSARYISISYLQNDIQTFNHYYNTVFWGNIGVGTCLFILLLLFIIKIDLFLVIPDAILSDVKILFVFVGLNFLITLASVAWKVYGQIKDRIDLTNLIEGISSAFHLSLLIFMYWFLTPNIWYVGLATFLPSLVVLVSSVYLSYKYLPEIHIRISDVSKNAFKTLVIKGVWNAIDGLGNTLNTGLDLLITDLMLTSTEMGKVSVAKTASLIVPKFYSMISNSFYPKILSAYSSHNIYDMIKWCKRAMRICAAVTNSLFICFVFLGEDFLRLWIPNQDIKTIYILIVISLIPCVVEGVTYPLYSIFTLTTKIMVPTMITIVCGLINVVSMYVLLKNTTLGIYAVVITTAFIVTVAHLFTPFYSCICLGIERKTFITSVMHSFFSLGVGIVLLKYIDRMLYRDNSVKSFVINGSILGTLCIGLQFLFLLLPDLIIILKREKRDRRDR